MEKSNSKRDFELLDRILESRHSTNQFQKFDKDKLRYSLIPYEAVEALAKVLTYGAAKYEPNNWKKCDDTNRYIDALMRHLEAHRSGEVYDKESGLMHMSHVLTNAAFMVYFLTQSEKLDKYVDKAVNTHKKDKSNKFIKFIRKYLNN